MIPAKLSARLTRIASATVLSLGLAACGVTAAPPDAPVDTPPDVIVVREPNIRPEGLDYDPTSRRFFVSSTSDGTVYAVNEDGSSAPFIPSADSAATLGVEVDAARNRLLVVSTDLGVLFDPNARGRASLGVYDLATGDRMSSVDLTGLSPNGRPFGNDLAVDPDGNVYVSDSLAPVIYKVDRQGSASVLVNDARLTPGPVPFLDDVAFGVGGIAYQDGSLLVAQDSTSQLFAVPLTAPQNLSEVTVDVPFYADGLITNGRGQLVAVGNGKISTFESRDGWRTATETLVSPGHEASTSVALRGDDTYALYAYFGHEEPRDTYEIVRVRFGAA